ncbi:putative secreted protein (Por secretion system target) [Tenacibaculum skagerrakense]|uniref:Putative secreted protein (Por secretion system target) n=1 Tax=Tenacibaculum skagerrakense TaxID=186571 RepID=A0A4R2NZT2_9FLAO|nr:GEVED domain-containing protein [Tenacibaculum skagerrakense]TCP27859.1 putative secreted protein (Por secretion system target) [Tenacibaculum skagerrakense]
MKKITLLFLLLTGVVFAQQQRNCHSMDNLEYRQQKDPALKQRMQEIEEFTQNKLMQLQNVQGRIEGSIIKIPVVVHVIYSNAQENISDAQIQSQLDVLNEDFRRTNSDANNKWSQAADTQIEFELAAIDPNGNPTSGITRKSSTRTSWGTNDAMKSSSQGGVSPWNTAEYLNMWVCNIGGGILGYAQFPGGSASTDGVVMSPQYFGSSDKGSGFYLSAPFDKGRTTTHEVGHFLNLRHIWGDGGCSVDDFVSDTPTSDAANYGCATGHVSCGSEDMVENYMDYSDDSCMNLFTVGQKNRMRAVLEAGGSRRSLALSDKSTPAVCNATTPTGVSVSAVSSSGATVSWNSVAGATYDVRYRQTGTTTWTVNAVSGTSTTLSGLAATTGYQVQVRSKCSSGNSAYSATVSFTTTEVQLNYCASKGNNVNDEYIGRVAIGSINNASGNGNGYSDFTSISTSLAKSASATITITPTWTGTVYNEGYAVFIDYNQDGDFTDSGETVWTRSATQTTPVSGSFTVPASAASGATRMRVSMKYNGVPTSCETFSYGEVEDYTVVIGAGAPDTQAPSTPSNVQASSVTQTTATISWNASSDNVGVTGYDVYRGSTLVSSTSSTSLNVSGLSANTSYTYSVRAKDAAGNVSGSGSVTFTTLSNQVTYCTSSGSRTQYEWIDNVELGGIANATGAGSGYSDFTSQVGTLARGSSNTMIVSAGFSGSSYTEYWAVWIDFNQDGTFSSTEKVVSGSSSSANNLSATVNVPSNAVLGQTRMRVSMKYNAAQTACENFGDGEVEDYTINITNSARGNDVTTNADALGNEASIGLTAFPNPATSFVQVRLNNRAEGLTSYSIVNTIGQTVQRGELTNGTINVANLTFGMYILEVNDGQKSFKTKLIKR